VALPVPSSSAGADRRQVELLRAAGPTRRAQLALSLSDSVIAMARRAIRGRSPCASETEVLLQFAEIHYGARLARDVRAYLDRRRR